jgi:hypothetical protein
MPIFIGRGAPLLDTLSPPNAADFAPFLQLAGLPNRGA